MSALSGGRTTDENCPDGQWRMVRERFLALTAKAWKWQWQVFFEENAFPSLQYWKWGCRARIQPAFDLFVCLFVSLRPRCLWLPQWPGCWFCSCQRVPGPERCCLFWVHCGWKRWKWTSQRCLHWEGKVWSDCCLCALLGYWAFYEGAVCFCRGVSQASRFQGFNCWVSQSAVCFLRFYDGMDEINESSPMAGKSDPYEWLNDTSVSSVPLLACWIPLTMWPSGVAFRCTLRVQVKRK